MSNRDAAEAPGMKAVVPGDESRPLSTGDVCAKFGIGRQTVRRLVIAGRLTVAARTLGGQMRFLESDVEALYEDVNP